MLQLGIRSYTVAELPTATAAMAGTLAWCTDNVAGTPGAAALVVCNGAGWVLVDDNSTAPSAT